MLGKRLLQLAVLMIGFLLVASCTAGVMAQDDAAQNPVILADENGITLPENLVAGMTTLTIQNDTETAFAPILMRLNDGVSMDDFMSTMQSNPQATLALVSVLGGLEVPPQESIDLTYDLSAGNYLLFSAASLAPPTILPFTVAEIEAATSTAEPPEVDVPVVLVDFSFGMPSEFSAGKQLWSLTNNGEQPHEMRVMHVDDDAELADVTAALMDVIMTTPDGQTPEFPYETVVNWSPMSPGEQVWANVSLEAGTYVVVCFIPDFTAQEFVTHMQHGMIQLVTVSE